VSRARSRDWPRVCHRLALTVCSALGTAGPGDRVVIAHDERPPGAFWADPRVISVQVPPASVPQGSQADKNRKRRAAGAWARAALGDCLVMGLDADDLVHRDLAVELRARPRAEGLRLVAGLRLRLSGNRLTGEVLARDFDHACGSCFVGRFRAGELPQDADDDGSAFGRCFRGAHRHYARQFRQATGRPAVVLDRPLVAYVVDPAISLRIGLLRGRLGGLVVNRATLAAWLALRRLASPRGWLDHDACLRILADGFLPPGGTPFAEGPSGGNLPPL